MTTRLMPTSATIAIQRLARPKRARTRTTALAPRARAMFWRMRARVARLWRTSQGRPARSSAIRTMSAVSSAAPLEMPPRATLTRAAARAGASLTPSPTMPVGPRAASRSAIGRRPCRRAGGPARWSAMPELAGHRRGRRAVVAGEHDRLGCPARSSSARTRGGLGPRAGRPGGSSRAGRTRPSGRPTCRRRSSARPSRAWNSGGQRPASSM